MPLEDLFNLSLPLFFLLAMGTEAVGRSGRCFPTVRRWRLLGISALVVTLAVNVLVAPAVLGLLPLHSPLDLRELELWAAVPTVILTTFFTYWTHRIQHRYDVLWRLGHQLHHSVQRIDIASAMMFHPIDVAVQAAATTLAAWLLGVSVEAAALAGAIGFAIALFQHWNVGTPRWIGLLVQRPEAHCLHHEREVHARNYGDLPVWDMLFGTYANPAQVDVPVGFAGYRSKRIGSMILCFDVHAGGGRSNDQDAMMRAEPNP
ncbi:sterol desaturase family protein [Novosphingobium sp. EMRT-2]|uniref:sterol desaturase family protein n=1 Tax=Novosphingobium sp. EMRT-2 TaxID=2571749 RepID=UPI0010BD9A7E|nr:sterol desaturase family protein [Novosphingobium sp. EMRT-2]MCH2219412.1 sterol desaturase family protein [Dechloromonas sp.]QCI92380.1 sterol desaturase family protein [Novosphingobium sp. EMRT-2]